MEIKNFLVIDATKDKIRFFSYFNNKSYNKSFKANKINNDMFSSLLFNFFDKNNINLKNLNNIFINKGPGNFSGIRTSITVIKALKICNKLNVYGFVSSDIKDMNYSSIIDLFKNGKLKKNLINPVYSS
tara:strand:+ start:105 stop:491 length:387 start_codon:yes stop_codon:yes gene_type:complete